MLFRSRQSAESHEALGTQEASSTSSSSSSSAPEAENLDRMSSSGSSEPEAELLDEGSEVMTILQMLLWNRTASSGSADLEDSKLIAVATSEIADLLPAVVEEEPKPKVDKRRHNPSTPSNRNSRDQAMERRPMREAPAKKLEASENSWAAQQKARKAGDQESGDEESVVRDRKSVV